MKVFAQALKKWIPSEDNLKESPKLEYVDPLFKRRFSQLTKMTIQVLHEITEEIPEAKNYKIIFVTAHGEISRQYTLTKEIVENKQVLPAGFSLSVFNTPVAAATISLGLKGGYSVLLPSEGNFKDAFINACAPVLSEDEEKIIFVYGDEMIPDVFKEYTPQKHKALCFGMILCKKKTEGTLEIDIDSLSADAADFMNTLFY